MTPQKSMSIRQQGGERRVRGLKPPSFTVRHQCMFSGAFLAVLVMIYGGINAKNQELLENQRHLNDRLHRASSHLIACQETLNQQKESAAHFEGVQALGFLKDNLHDTIQSTLEDLMMKKPLDHLSYDSERSEKKLFGGLPCRLTRITLSFEHAQDQEILNMIQELPTHLSSAIISEQLVLIRQESHVTGSYVFYILTLEKHSS